MTTIIVQPQEVLTVCAVPQGNCLNQNKFRLTAVGKPCPNKIMYINTAAANSNQDGPVPGEALPPIEVEVGDARQRLRQLGAI